ncbi:MAG TPA: flavin reductase [Phycisphaerae bacterium]|nr:flavin reductase [Phycisphaerae bacterium]
MDDLSYCPPGAAYPKCKYPEWITILGLKDSNGRVNLMPAGWGIELCQDPPLVGVSVGLERYSHEMFQGARYFSWTAPSLGAGPDVYFCGTRSGRDVDKTQHLTGITLAPGSVCDVPVITGARRCAECELIGHMFTGDHRMFVGRVLHDHVDPERPRLLNFNDRLYAPALPDPATTYMATPQARPDVGDSRWVSLIVVEDTDRGRCEILPINALTITSHDPAQVAIALPTQSYAARLIEASGHFTFCWPVAGMGPDITACLTMDGRTHDKFAETAFRRIPPRRGRAPLIDGCVAAVECRTVARLAIEPVTMFVGQVLAAHRLADGPRIQDFGHGTYALARVDLANAWQGPQDT